MATNSGIDVDDLLRKVAFLEEENADLKVKLQAAEQTLNEQRRQDEVVYDLMAYRDSAEREIQCLEQKLLTAGVDAIESMLARYNQLVEKGRIAYPDGVDSIWERYGYNAATRDLLKKANQYVEGLRAKRVFMSPRPSTPVRDSRSHTKAYHKVDTSEGS